MNKGMKELPGRDAGNYKDKYELPGGDEYIYDTTS